MKPQTFLCLCSFRIRTGTETTHLDYQFYNFILPILVFQPKSGKWMTSKVGNALLPNDKSRESGALGRISKRITASDEDKCDSRGRKQSSLFPLYKCDSKYVFILLYRSPFFWRASFSLSFSPTFPKKLLGLGRKKTFLLIKKAERSKTFSHFFLTSLLLWWNKKSNVTARKVSLTESW